MEALPKLLPLHSTEVHFASFLSGGFTTMHSMHSAIAVINPPESKLAKHTSVHYRILFCKIQARPQSCWYYLSWRPWLVFGTVWDLFSPPTRTWTTLIALSSSEEVFNWRHHLHWHQLLWSNPMDNPLFNLVSSPGISTDACHDFGIEPAMNCIKIHLKSYHKIVQRCR